jgi:hypothetical protein
MQFIGQTLSRVQIDHNHGVLVLRDVTVDYYDHKGWPDDKGAVLRGTVVNGHSTSRLFHVTSTRHEIPGVEQTYDIWGKHRSLRLQDDGTYVINMQFCG